MLEGLFDGILDHLWFQLSLLLMVAIASSFLFARFKQPKVIGQIVVGMVIGPSVLGLITVNQSDPGDMVHRFAELGAIILLFMIGLECDFREIYTKRSILIALGGVFVPWVCGFALAEVMLPDPGNSYDKFSQSVFVGAALVATSVAITAGVLREMKLVGSDVAKILLGAAIVDDVLGMIVLAVSAGTATGGVELGDLAWLVIASVLFVSLGAYLGSKFATKVISSVHRRGLENGIEESGFLLALGLAFVYAVISEMIGISAIVGAFVAGTSFARCDLRAGFHKHMSVLEWVFAPIFFVSLGILVDLEQISMTAWVFAAVLTAVAFATKVIGCGVPARLLGLSRREAMFIGVGMSPRMEVAMIIALYGLTVGIVSMELYSVIVLMGLLTALFTPSLLRRIMKDAPRTEAAVCDTQ
jgi:Kef-type K+ transport system membrane component KefB